MRKAIIFTILIALILSGTSTLQAPLYAAGIPAGQLATEPCALAARAHPVADMSDPLSSGNISFGHARQPYDFDYWEISTTWQDLQSIGSNGKRIQFGPG